MHALEFHHVVDIQHCLQPSALLNIIKRQTLINYLRLHTLVSYFFGILIVSR